MEKIKEIAELRKDTLIMNQKKVDKLQERIDKAIKYIEECIDSEDIYEQFLSTGETQKVLNILQGEDEDE